jgi:protoporphyrin/coproporphyrin ferrochelatase
MARTGIILLGFGGPDSLDAVGPFMCNLMGREPSPELVERVQGNYRVIGGSSPLADIAERIAAELEADLADRGHEVPVRVGMRYWDPLICDALADLAEQGCDRVITVSLSPFETKVASGAYRTAIAEALEADGVADVEVIEAPLASELPEFARFYAEELPAAIGSIESDPVVVFTAHSLPVADLAEQDPYVNGLRDTADAIASHLGWDVGSDGARGCLGGSVSAFGADGGAQPWVLVYQSKGQRPGEWLGPLLDEVLDAAAAGAARAVVVCPIGFMTDHMETLFDLDYVAGNKAEEAGLEFVRVPTPNEDAVVVGSLAVAVEALL